MILLFFVLFFATRGTYKAWVITDTHTDNQYSVGSAAKCFSIDCCHEDSRPRKNTENEVAGRCGNTNCYAPLDTVASSFDFINAHKDKTDVVFWLMDAVPGDVVRQSKEINKETITSVVEQMKKRMPGLRVYPVPGNHDYFLSSNWEYPPKSQWMLDHLSDLFSDWLSPTALETFKKGGYYTEIIEPGIRVISLNLVYFDTFSTHCSEYQETDPANEVAWFKDTLQNAKENNEKVMIISHECMGIRDDGTLELTPKFNEDYADIMKTYGGIVIAQLCGHTHMDAYRLLPNYTDATFPSIVNPALTTWGNLNPKFKIIEYDKDSVVNWETFMLNISECNLMESGYNWVKDYNAGETYGITRFDVEGLREWTDAMRKDESVFQTFVKHFKAEDFVCTGNCRERLLCAFTHHNEQEYIDCLTNQ
ncbi:sphingomyelin phosphodiesterase, putative [Entamoeba invadens IP1]|uniref:Sphingomyelin phosphodiesterase, putative n=1 Tax=Entamoeba invadens IP1 TaxID=370355 RepID=A0A0A1U4P1_ENTIV|nr:sphingomyelin phosphodiesterase, putative [Entamoeba invadens IP1]ELP89169.1 sphingomyelin phosphodiesterase, putative [Entamoeba invadens IP1]|eukprot:XP_004255940.1 sphingomyelin phosphodiesterase, putative [Entamoeba invadens IP1]